MTVRHGEKIRTIIRDMKYIHELTHDAGITDVLPAAGCPVKLNGRNRVNILALGDVGTTMLTGLILLGGDVISEIGILDIRRENLERLEMEMNQIGYPFGMKEVPLVHILSEEELFDCDLMIFCASRGVPPVKSEVTDVRMAQLEANREIIAHYGRLARAAEYKGMVAVVSDPVDNLAAAFLDSAELEPWQIQGYGLGVMNKRAEYYADKIASGELAAAGDQTVTPELREAAALYLSEGRAYGPHGQDLVIANSMDRYDEAASELLTELTVNANIRDRDLGYKPYIAPALSSAAISVLLTLRGEWHYGSVYFGSRDRGAFLGIRNRLTAEGWEYEDSQLPEPLYERIRKAYNNLCEIR